MNSSTIKILKSTHSENVIRKSLYWLSEECTWKLQEDNEYWLITLKAGNKSINEIEDYYHQLLNDFILREKHDKETKHLRTKIVKDTLVKLYKND